MLGELLKFGNTGLMSKDPRVSIHGLEAKQYEGECVLLNKELTQLFKIISLDDFSVSHKFTHYYRYGNYKK